MGSVGKRDYGIEAGLGVKYLEIYMVKAYVTFLI